MKSNNRAHIRIIIHLNTDIVVFYQYKLQIMYVQYSLNMFKLLQTTFTCVLQNKC